MTIVASNSLTISNVNDGTITHTAYAYSADGTDRFTTVYPNLNLIEDGKFAKPISSKWNSDGTTISKDNITGYFKVKFNGASLNRTYYTAGISTIPIGQKYSAYIKAYSLESSLNIKIGSVNTSQAVTVTNNSNIPKTYKVEGLVRGTSDTFGIFGGLTTTLGTLFISEIKLEQGSTATPWMPSSSEVTTADWPSFIGQYMDFTQANSTNPSNYTWSLIRGNDGVNGTSITITSKQILYQNSTSGTTAPTGTWSTTIPSTPQGQFRWARTIVNYSDDTSTQTDLVGYVGVDGQVGPQGDPTGITQQATEPTNKYAGMMWQYTGNSNITIGSTTIYPQVQYIYDGSKWIIYAINVANLNVQTLAAITANLGTVTAGVIKSYIDYTYYNNSPTGIPAKAYLRIDANNVNQKLALQSPSGTDWGYIRQDTNGLTIFTDTQNAGSIGNASGRYVSTNYSGAGLNFINSNNASVNANGDLDVATPYTGRGSLYFDGTNLISSAPIIALNTIVKSYSFSVGGLGVRLDRLMSQVMVTFSGQVSQAITTYPTFNNQLPTGFCPISPASVDYIAAGNPNASGYIYFNPDGSIHFMSVVPQGAYIRGTRSYITADAYPS